MNVTFGTGAKTTAKGLGSLLFPAMSVACKLMEFVPGVNVTLQVKLSPLRAGGEPLQVKLASPESVSVIVPAMTSGDVKTLAPLVREVTVSAGGVLSSFTVMNVLAVLPALLCSQQPDQDKMRCRSLRPNK